MIQVAKLKEAIKAQGQTQRTVADHLGISERSFYSKMQRGIFDSDEIEEMVMFLSIKNPSSIFFA